VKRKDFLLLGQTSDPMFSYTVSWNYANKAQPLHNSKRNFMGKTPACSKKEESISAYCWPGLEAMIGS
jgi:hypothetical protein